jgi:hypothetical protein
MATKVLTSSQLTFVDITDQRKLSAYLTSNLTTVQTLDSGVYNPSWDTSNLVITPQVFIDQTPLSLSNVTIVWKRKDGNNAETDLKTGESVSNNILTVSANNLGTSASGMLTYTCYVTYMDAETGQTVNITDHMTYTLIKAAENAKTCFISGPQVFKYDKDGVCTSDTQITLTATVQNVAISKWQYYNPTSKTYEDYPSTTENVNITGSVLHVTNAHAVFDSAGVAKIKLITSDASVYDVITIAKVYDGATGAAGTPGENGESAYTILLTNESYSFPGTTNTAKESNVTTEILAYQGTVQKSATIKTVNGKAASSAKTETGITGLSFSVSGAVITFYASEELTMASGTVPIVVAIDEVEYTKVFSWSVSYTGAGACSLSIEASSQIFKSTDGATYTPDTITLTPIVQNLALSSVQWKYSTNGGNTWADVTNTTSSASNIYYNATTKVLTIPKGFTGFTPVITSIVFRCINGDYTDSITIARLSDGQSASAAYTIILSNEMQGIATNNKLVPLESNAFECAITVYKGSEQLAATNGDVGEGSFKVILPPSPTGITLAQAVAGEVTFSVSNSTAIASTGTIGLTIQIESTDNVIVKSISYSASKSGSDGTSAITFMVWAPNGDVFSNQTGTLPLSALAYEGATDITSNATFQWYKYISGEYQSIVGATDSTYQVNGADVVNIQTYKCVMTYNTKEYSGVYTMEDKSDTYVSEMLTVGGTTFKNGQGGSAVYVVVRANGVEKDPFPTNCSIGATAPLNPTSGTYWWQLANNAVQLMKYNGTSWAVSDDDPQTLNYTWSLMNKDGHSTDFSKTGKVIYLSCADIHSIGTLQCDISTKE